MKMVGIFRIYVVCAAYLAAEHCLGYTGRARCGREGRGTIARAI